MNQSVVRTFLLWPRSLLCGLLGLGCGSIGSYSWFWCGLGNMAVHYRLFRHLRVKEAVCTRKRMAERVRLACCFDEFYQQDRTIDMQNFKPKRVLRNGVLTQLQACVRRKGRVTQVFVINRSNLQPWGD